MNAVVYLFQVSACMGIFYLFYYLLLSRYTFFTTNRCYLIITLAISFVIPLLTITVNQHQSYPQVIKQVVYINQMQVPQQVVTAPAPVQPQLSLMTLISAFYILPVAILALRLIWIITRFFSDLRGKTRTKIGAVHIVKGDDKIGNGSFFNFIFLNDDELSADELEQIIAHEMLHVKLYHSVDRVLVKIAQVILWFNPFVYLYARAIEENHEFEVDRAISNQSDRNKYAELLFHLSVARQGTLYNNFSMVPLKKRITMLFTKPTNRIKRTMYLFFVPVVLISCLAFAKLKNENPIVAKKINPIIDADSANVKYRQKSKLTPIQRKAQDYLASGAGLNKVQSAANLTGKTMTFVATNNVAPLKTKPVKIDTGKLTAIDGLETLGINPLVLIDGKEYGKEILYKISMRGIRSWSMMLPNNANIRYGDKAKDGAVIITTHNGEINYLSDNEKRNIVKQQAAKGKFFSRIRLTEDDGSEYDMAILNRASGSRGSTNVPVNGKIAFIINNEIYPEAEFKRVFPADRADLGRAISVGGATQGHADRGFKLEGYYAVFEFPEATVMAVNKPVKTGAVSPAKIRNNNRIAGKNAVSNAPQNRLLDTKDTIDKTKSVKQLLANASGVEVRADGTLWVNGQQVKKAMINGKEYEAGDRQQPVNTLPDDIIKKVKTPTIKVSVDGKEFIPNGVDVKKEK